MPGLRTGPDLLAIDFDDAPAFFLSREPALQPILIEAGHPQHALRGSRR